MKRTIWVSVLVALGAACFGVLGVSCGAVSLEPLPPDEPLPEAAPPRLMRRDPGAPTVDGGGTAFDD